MNRLDVRGLLRKARGAVKAAVVVLFASALCGCASLEVERDGELFPSTQRTAQGSMSLVPSAIIMTGYCYEPIGAVLYPFGFACHLVEVVTIAPVVDVVCLPYDLAKFMPRYAKRRREKRRAKEWEEAVYLVNTDLAAALADPRYTASTNTVQSKALKRRIWECPDFLRREETESVFAAIIADPDLMPVLGGVASFSELDPGKLDLFVESAIRMRESGSLEDADRLAKAICSSPNVKDGHLDQLRAAGFPKEVFDKKR